MFITCQLTFWLTLVLSKANSRVLPLVRNISTALSLSCHQRLCTSLISSYVQEKEGASVSPWRHYPNTKRFGVVLPGQSTAIMQYCPSGFTWLSWASVALSSTKYIPDFPVRQQQVKWDFRKTNSSFPYWIPNKRVFQNASLRAHDSIPCDQLTV